MIIADLFARLAIKPDTASFANADRLLGVVKGAIAGIVAIKTVHFGADLVRETQEAASGFVDLGRKLGIAIEPLQQLGYAAKSSGSNVDELALGLTTLSRTAASAVDGSEEARKTFHALGISSHELLSGALPLDAALGQIADRFAAMSDGPKKLALATDTFGKAGTKLIPLLNQGSDGVRKLRQEFVDLGAQIDGKSAQELKEFADEQERLKTVMTGLRNQAVIALLPELQKMASGMLEWVKANRTLIRTRLEQFIKALTTGLKALAKVIGFVIDHWEVLTVALTSVVLTVGIAKLIGLMQVLGVTSLRAGLQAAAGWFIALLPYILVAAAIFALILILEDLWVALNGGDSVLGDLHDWFVDAFVGWIDDAMTNLKVFWSWLGDELEKFGDWIDDLLGNVRILQNVQRKAIQKQADDAIAKAGQAIAEIDVALRASEMRDITGLDTFPGMGMAGVPRLPVSAVPTNQVELAPHFEINVTAPAGSDAEHVGRVVKEATGQLWDSYLRDAHAAVGG